MLQTTEQQETERVMERIKTMIEQRIKKHSAPLYHTVQRNIADLNQTVFQTDTQVLRLVHVKYRTAEYDWNKELIITKQPSVFTDRELILRLSDSLKNHIHVTFALSSTDPNQQINDANIKVHVKTNPRLRASSLNKALSTLLNEWTKEPMDDVLARCQTKISQAILMNPAPDK